MIHPTAKIHPSSIVEDGAKIGENVVIGPFCVIEKDVEIGKGTILYSHVVVRGITKIGEDNQIFQGASISEINQNLKYMSCRSRQKWKAKLEAESQKWLTAWCLC